MKRLITKWALKWVEKHCNWCGICHKWNGDCAYCGQMTEKQALDIVRNHDFRNGGWRKWGRR